MKFSKRIPLAIKQLKDSPIKTAAATAGICFSNVLVFFQLGLLESIYQSQSRPYSLLDGEIVIVSSRFKRLSQSPTISISDIMRAKGVEGVAKVSTLSIELGSLAAVLVKLVAALLDMSLILLIESVITCSTVAIEFNPETIGLILSCDFFNASVNKLTNEVKYVF